LVRAALKEDGVCLVNVSDSGFDFLDFVNSLGTPSSHNLHDHFIWDIKVTNTNNTLARSLTAEPFSLHTDCSFEQVPPRFFALYVLQPDTKGGGETLLIDMKDILANLPSELAAVLQTDFVTKVPSEFYKGETFAHLPILFGESCIRYRPECIDLSRCSQQQRSALGELDNIIARHSPQKLVLSQNSVLVVDNYRYLHGRTKVLDPQRHLQRIRFN
jgi:alpha-ketoglutarate-dependent taurine dioxygenase